MGRGAGWRFGLASGENGHLVTKIWRKFYDVSGIFWEKVKIFENIALHCRYGY